VDLIYSIFSETGQYKTRTADYGPRTGLGIKHEPGIKRRLNIKCGLSLKIAVLTNKYQKMLLFQFSPALLSRVSFIYSISFNNLKILKITFKSDNNKELRI